MQEDLQFKLTKNILIVLFIYNSLSLVSVIFNAQPLGLLDTIGLYCLPFIVYGFVFIPIMDHRIKMILNETKKAG